MKYSRPDLVWTRDAITPESMDMEDKGAKLRPNWEEGDRSVETR